MKKITEVRIEEVHFAGNPFGFTYVPRGKRFQYVCKINEAEYNFNKKVKWELKNDLEQLVNAVENGNYEASTPYRPNLVSDKFGIYHQEPKMFNEEMLEAIDVVYIGGKDYSVQFFVEVRPSV